MSATQSLNAAAQTAATGGTPAATSAALPPSNTAAQDLSGAFSITTAQGGVSGGQNIISPSAVYSPYEFSTVAAQQVSVGPTIAAMLGISPGTYSGTDLIRAYDDMSVAKMTSLQTMLYGAGMYVDGDGDPLTTRPDFGIVNTTNLFALMNAINTAANGGESIDGLLARNQAMGVGSYIYSQQPTPVTGGGQTYQVNLTSPNDVYSQAFSTYEQYLGRAPTATELSALTAVVQKQETSYQTELNTQAETMSRAKYTQDVNARNSQLQYNLTPQANLGAVPNGPFDNASQWAIAVLNYLGMPTTTSNVAFLTAWVQAQGGFGGEGFNPLKTVLGAPGGTTGASGAATFRNFAQGIQATANLLMSPAYGPIYQALISGDAGNETKDAGVQAALSKWADGKTVTLNTGGSTAKNAAAEVAKSRSVAKTQQPAQGLAAAQTNGWTPPAGPTNEKMGTPTTPGAGTAPGAPTTTTTPQAPNELGQGSPTTTVPPGNPATPPTATPPGAPGAAPTDGPPISPAQIAALNAPTPGATPGAPAGAPAQAQGPLPGAATTTTSAGPPQTSGQSIPAADVNPQQGVYSPGDSYLPPSTVSAVQAPSVSSDAFVQATTGSNAIEYLAQQYLAAFGTVAGMISSGNVT